MVSGTLEPSREQVGAGDNLRTVTHLQITMEQRIRRGNGYLNDRAHSTRKHASYITVDSRGRAEKHSSAKPCIPNFKAFGPGWLMPKVLQTVTAAIIWGACGRMADVEEY